jgi:hypothetical protein
VTDDEIIEFASEFREGILDGRPSNFMCAAISWPLSTLLELNGVQCTCVEVDLGDCNHIWIKLADGRALDPTADQFNMMWDKYPPVYLGERIELHYDCTDERNPWTGSAKTIEAQSGETERLDQNGESAARRVCPQGEKA